MARSPGVFRRAPGTEARLTQRNRSFPVQPYWMCSRADEASQNGLSYPIACVPPIHGRDAERMAWGARPMMRGMPTQPSGVYISSATASQPPENYMPKRASWLSILGIPRCVSLRCGITTCSGCQFLEGQEFLLGSCPLALNRNSRSSLWMRYLLAREENPRKRTRSPHIPKNPIQKR